MRNEGIFNTSVIGGQKQEFENEEFNQIYQKLVQQNREMSLEKTKEIVGQLPLRKVQPKALGATLDDVESNKHRMLELTLKKLNSLKREEQQQTIKNF